MAMQIINDPYRTFGGGLGASIGQGLQQGLGSHLEEMAQQRMMGLKNKFALDSLEKELTLKSSLKSKERAAIAEQHAPALAKFLSAQGINVTPEEARSFLESDTLETALKYGVQRKAAGQTAYTAQQILPLVGNNKAKADVIAQMGDPKLQQLAIKAEQEGQSGQALSDAIQAQLNPGQQISPQAQGPELTQAAPPAIGGGLGRRDVVAATQIGQTAQGQAAADRRHRESLDAHAAEKIMPVLEAQAEDYGISTKIKERATTMLKILESNKAKWPTISGYLPDQIQRDPQVRKYVKDAADLAIMITEGQKGRPSDYKTRLNQSTKPALDQPYETQKAILQRIISDADKTIRKQDDIADIRKKNKGKYPLDITTQLSDRDLARTDPLKYPDAFKEGTEIKVDGVLHKIELKNGKKQWSNL